MTSPVLSLVMLYSLSVLTPQAFAHSPCMDLLVNQIVDQAVDYHPALYTNLKTAAEVVDLPTGIELKLTFKPKLVKSEKAASSALAFAQALNKGRAPYEGLASPNWALKVQPIDSIGRPFTQAMELGLYVNPITQGLYVLMNIQYILNYNFQGENFFMDVSAVKSRIDFWLSEFRQQFPDSKIEATVLAGPGLPYQGLYAGFANHSAAIELHGATSAEEYAQANLFILGRAARMVKRMFDRHRTPAKGPIF